jgi:hypothetical protein
MSEVRSGSAFADSGGLQVGWHTHPIHRTWVIGSICLVARWGREDVYNLKTYLFQIDNL